MRRSRPWWLQLIRAIDYGPLTPGRSAAVASPAGGYWPTDGARPAPPREEVSLSHELHNQRLRYYEIGCELATAELSEAEGAALRERGELPPWFYRAIDPHAAAERAGG